MNQRNSTAILIRREDYNRLPATMRKLVNGPHVLAHGQFVKAIILD